MSRAILLNRKQGKDVIAIGGVGGFLSRHRVSQQQQHTLVPPQLLFPVVLTSPLGPAATGHLQSCFPDRGWTPTPLFDCPGNLYKRNVTPPCFPPLDTHPLTASLPLSVSLSRLLGHFTYLVLFRVSSSLPTTTRAPPAVVAASPVHIPQPPLPLDTAAVPTPSVRHHLALHLALDSSCGVCRVSCGAVVSVVGYVNSSACASYTTTQSAPLQKNET